MARKQRKPKYTKEVIAKALKKTGYLPASEIDQHPDLPSRTTILKLFKTTSITNVWEELSIPTPYTKEEVSKALKTTGYLPQIKIEQHPNLPSHTTILKLFKTNRISDVWNELDIPFTPQPSYTKEEVAKALKETGYLSLTEIDQHPDLPSRRTIFRLFKTSKINDIWKELNIDTPQRKKVNS